MPCNCGGAVKAPAFKYIYTDGTTGRQHTYNTEIEAKAAQIRAGGGGNIRSEPK